MKTHHTSFLLLLLLLLVGSNVAIQAQDTILIEYINICPTQSFVYRGLTIDKEGVYDDSLYTATGQLDSIYRLIVNESPSYYFRDTMTIYDGKPVTWRGRVYNTVGTYHEYYNTVLGCDSVYELFVRESVTHHFYDTVAVCRHELPVKYEGLVLYKEGDYDVPYTTVLGADSIFSLHLTVYDDYEKTIYHELCEGEAFVFRGEEKTEKGVYTDTLLSSHGCDSIIHFVVSFSNHVIEERSEVICSGDTFMFYDEELTEEGVYYHETQTNHGCEKTVKLVLTVLSPKEHKEEVHICPGETYRMHGVELTETGHYVDTLLTSAGCDSVVHIILNVHTTTPRSTLTLRTCEDEPVVYKGRTYSAPASFYDTVLTATGCDSIVHVVVQAEPNYLFKESGSLSEDGTYQWRGNEYDEPGIYYDSLRTAFGCDSVYQLTLCRNTTSEIHLWACQGDSIRYRDMTFTESTVYYDTLRNRYGCDSIIKVVSHFKQTYHYIEDKYICEGDVYVWREREYTYEGSYFDTLPTEQGCDSIFELRLTVGKPQLDSVHTEICQSELPYLWHGMSLYETNVYYDTLRTVKGCDSLCVLDLIVHPVFEHVEYHDICQGDYIIIDGDTVTETSVVEKTYITDGGCDSIYRTIVNVRHVDTIYQEAWICGNHSYPWRGQELSRANIYYDALPYSGDNFAACDSVVYILKLDVLESHEEKTEKVLCTDSLPFIWRERIFWTDTLVADTFVNVLGCDSIFTLQLTIAHCSEPDTVWLCPDGEVKVDAILYDAAGEYRNQVGPDTIHRFVVVNADTVVTRIDSTICSSRLPFTMGGIRIFEDMIDPDTVNIFRERLTTQHGCDSIIELHLTVVPSYFITKHVRVCHDDVYLFRGTELTKSGIYYDTLYSSGGCDSIMRLVLTHEEASFVNQTVTINRGGTYEWHGEEYSNSGTYYDTIRSVTIEDCDSIIYCLRLTVNEGYQFYDTVHVCSNNLPYRWFGQSLTESGSYMQQYTTIHGADSIYSLLLVVDSTYLITEMQTICSGKPYSYYDTLISSCGCDSVVHVVVNRAKPSPLTIINLSVCQNEPYVFRGVSYQAPCVLHDTLLNREGCDSVVRYVVNAFPSVSTDRYDTIFEGQTYRFDGEDLYKPGTYIKRGKTANGCDSIVRLHLFVYNHYYREDTVTLCYDSPDFPYIHNNREYRVSTLFKDTFLTPLGYDSVIWTHLVIYPRIPETVIPVSLCNQDVVLIHGEIVTQEGNYYDTLSSVLTGCDSVLHYIVNRGTPSAIVTVNISTCQGEPYYFRGKEYEAPCVIYDTLLNAFGCDSVVKYVVNAYPSVRADRYDTIYEGQTYRFDGEDLYKPGTYIKRGKTANGCDSIVRLHLFVYNHYYREDTVTLCYDSPDFPYIHNNREYRVSTLFKDTFLTPFGYDSVIWTHLLIYPRIPETVIPVSLCNQDVVMIHGHIVTQEGNYYDTLSSVISGCDSILHYIVNRGTPSAVVSVNVSTCQGEPYYFRGKEYAAPCVFYDTLLNTVGCDSVVRYVVNAYPSVIVDRYDTIIEGETYRFNNESFHLPGTYVLRGKTVNGCDSIIRLHLHMYYPHFHEDTVTLCYNSPDFPYVHHGREYRTSTIFKDTFLTPLGYDSVVWTRLVIYPRIPETVIPISLCNDDVLHIRGEVINKPGNYYDTIASKVSGCDSVLHYIVRQGQTYFVQQKDSFCLNEGYVWRGHRHDTILRYPGVYYDRLISSAGCDSIYELTLTGKEVFFTDTTILVCPDEFPIVHHGKLLYEARLVNDTFKSVTCGCDSILRTNYKLTQKCSDIDHIYRCVNEELHLGDVNIQNAGYYRLDQWTRTGRDSVYRVRVDTAFPSFDTIYASICQGDTFHLGHINATTPGTHRLTGSNRFGCDSLTVLQLTVFNRSYATPLRVNVADYDLPYIWRHQPYLESGTYEDYTYDRSNGCIDSVYRLQLNVIQTRYDTLSYSICRGDSVRFRQQWYDQTTYLTDTIKDMQIGRSSVTVFDLQVSDSTRIADITVTSDCADAEELLLQTYYTGAKPETYSIRFLDDKAYQRGFTDQTNRPFSPSIRIPIPAYSGTGYTRPDNYRFRISFYSGACGYVIHEADFTIKYPSWIMEQKWDHMVALLNDSHNGGYRFTGYRWRVVGKNITSTEPYFYSPALTAGDTVIVALSLDGTGYIESCPFVLEGYKNYYHDQPVLVYPTAAPARRATIHIESEADGEWQVVNTAGEVCATGVYRGNTESFTLPEVSGCYLLVFRAQSGITITRKIVLY